jgi:hypothetical protein
LCIKSKDKSCFGVISEGEDPETRGQAISSAFFPLQKEEGDTRIYINSLGEGAIWVTNKNGPLESGDYITTSDIPGYGEKQDSEFLANYTVAKITMDCDFNPQLQAKEVILKEAVTNNSENVILNAVDESGNVVDESGNVVDESGNVVDESGNVVDESGNVVDESGNVVDESGNVVDGSGNVVDESGNVVDDSGNVVDGSGNVVDESGNVVDGSGNVVDESGNVVDESGNVVDESENIIYRNALDENGNIQWTPELDSDGKIVQEYAYNLRYLDVEGNRLTKDEYDTKLGNGEDVYIAAYVGCTYHCG